MFVSPLFPEELQPIDLRANGDLFPILANKEGDVRECQQKDPRSTPRSKKAWEDLAKHFQQKSQVFKDIEIAAHKQSRAYKQAARCLRMTKKIKASDTEIDLLRKEDESELSDLNVNRYVNLCSSIEY